MARQDSHIEYIVTQEAYERAYEKLPSIGQANQTVWSIPIMARQYRQNVSDTVNAGKWVMWAIAEETFEFTWNNGFWNLPANLVILNR